MLKNILLTISLIIFVGCGYSEDSTKTKRNKLNSTSIHYKSDYNAPKDPLYADQWYLFENYGINIDDLWENYLGDGVSVGVVDVGVEAKHEDLEGVIDFDRSYRYSDESNDPTPTQKEIDDFDIDESHGTAIAGLIAASHNQKGIMGIAPNVDLVALNVFSKPVDSTFKEAVSMDDIDIFSNSWGEDLESGFVDDRVVLNAISKKMKNDPAIYIFSSGNESSNSEFSSLLSSRYTLVVGSSNSDGKLSLYSNYGANILCVAPGGDKRGIISTDLSGDKLGYDNKFNHFDSPYNENYNYTDDFKGTSASAAIVSGVVALMKEANRQLSYRDIRYIIAHTARKIDKDDLSWIENSAGLLYSNYYGFGLIDAQKAVETAKNFQALGDEKVSTQSAIKTDEGRYEFDIDDDLVVEYVVLEIKTKNDIDRTKLTLYSANGTRSNLLNRMQSSRNSVNEWSFGTIAFMDEESEGRWILETSKEINIKSVTLKIYAHQK